MMSNNKKRLLRLSSIFAILLAVSTLFFGTLSASAETITETVSDYSVKFSSGSFYRNYSDAFYWSGAPEISLSFDDYSSNVSRPFSFMSDNDYDASLFFHYSVCENGVYKDAMSIRLSDTYAYRFPTTSVTSRTIDFDASSDASTYAFFVFAGGPTENLISTYDSLDDLAINEVFNLYMLNNIRLTNLSSSATSFSFIDSRNSIGYVKLFDSEYQSFFFSFEGSLPYFDGTRFDPVPCWGVFGVKLSADTHYSFRSSSTGSSLSTQLLAVYLVSIETTDYNMGYNAGYNAGYDTGYNAGYDTGYNAGYSDGFKAGEKKANETVTVGSASYNAGKIDGASSVGNYTFMSLISAVIDAPVRAFFGYTEDGVQHPGLFTFNILGYDMSGLVLSLFSCCVLIMIIKFCLGGK